MKFQTGTQWEKELGRIAKHSRVVIQRNHQLIHGYFAARRVTNPGMCNSTIWGSFLTEMNLRMIWYVIIRSI